MSSDAGTKGVDAMGAAVLPPRFTDTARAVDAALAGDMDRWLTDVPAKLAEAIRYALLGPGKRVRPILLLWSAQLCGPLGARSHSSANRSGGHGDVAAAAMPAAVAIEMLHTYSLVHDDLPAMDDDDLRRGRPTCHVVYGEGLAVLVGDALLTRAFEAIAASSLPADRIARLVAALAESAGAAGMIGGQAEDLSHEKLGGDLAAVRDIHERKTAALLSAACRMGAIAVGGDGAAEQAMARFGRSLGLAFQITDDLLDEVGQTAQLGKQAGKDRVAGKLTYPAVAGLEASRQAAAACVVAAEVELDELASRPGIDAERLADFKRVGRYIIERTR